MQLIETDFLVLGSGIAGLRAALELSRRGRVLVITKDQPSESNSAYAQGGVAVALAEDDAPALHLEDTLKAGAGLVSREAARVLVEEGPERVRELVAAGARFDRAEGRTQFTLEAAHSRNRVLHALGDATGWEIVRVLLDRVKLTPGIDVRAFACATDLVLQDGRVVGCSFIGSDGGAPTVVSARATLLATGGAGALFAETTNPAVATGDGIALGLRAGAAVLDLEFAQFHPTALDLAGAPRFLISEAARGEGGVLLNRESERFTDELAPRDQVARAIFRERQRGPVKLDLRSVGEERIRQRFPRILSTCLSYGLDITREAVPVSPAAHYLMGGVATDLDARTSLPGLFAAGETAGTGVHGANRLASNSLLEALVFGYRAAAAMVLWGDVVTPSTSACEDVASATVAPEYVAPLRRRNSALLALERSRAGMTELLGYLEGLRAGSGPVQSRAEAEARNLVDLTRAMARCALFREESRGAHFRSDFPATDDARFQKHSLYASGEVRLAAIDHPLEVSWR
jgi:L-aspartate oxidase